MKKLIVIIAIGLALLGQGIAQTDPSGNEKRMSLEDCILAAFQNNLNLAAESLTPEAARFAVRQASEVFIPQLAVGINWDSQNSASFSFIDAADQIITKDSRYSARVSQFFPTGGQLNVTLNSYRQESNRNFLTINPLFGSTLRFNFTQPLLRDFGFKMSRMGIIVAQHDRELTEAQFKATLIETIYGVEEAYWNLVFSKENLKVRQEALNLARDLLAKSTRELEVGTIPPIELLSARAEVASREADILQAEATVENSEDALRRLLNLTGDGETPPPDIIPLDKPEAELFQMSLEEAVQTASINRPDLESNRIGIRSSKLNLSYAKNQLLPNLSLEADYWSPGISGTQLVYQDNNPLTGVIIDTIEGGPSLALKDAFNFKYRNWYIGLILDIPLRSVLSRAQYSQAKVEAEQSQIRLKDREQEVRLEIQTALRAVETDFKRTQAYRIARELAEESLRAEEKKLMAGLSTNYTVLQFQRDLATARSNEIQALIDYNLSRARLARAMGTTLKDKNINISERP